jgi:hypothetical protein
MGTEIVSINLKLTNKEKEEFLQESLPELERYFKRELAWDIDGYELVINMSAL